jgi:GT2 family glycosyltransferase
VAPRVSVVVPNLNGVDLLGPCLAAVAAQTVEDVETIVVDNGSDDGSTAFVRERFPHVRVFPLSENRGFASAMNVGIAAAEAPLIAFLNNDAEPAPTWLEELERCMQRHPRAAAAASKLLRADDPGTLDGAGDGLTRTFRPIARGHGRPDEGNFDDEVEVFGASGTASLWRGDVLHALGGFDERFFAYYEDVDLSFRARLAGWECWYAPRSVSNHRRGATAGGDLRFTLYLPARNRWFFLLKNAPASLLLRHPVGLLIEDGFWLLRAFRARAPGTLIRAYGEVIAQLRPLLRERRRLQRSRAVSPSALNRLLSRSG